MTVLCFYPDWPSRTTTPLSCKIPLLWNWECQMLPDRYWSVPPVDQKGETDGWDLQLFTPALRGYQPKAAWVLRHTKKRTDLKGEAGNLVVWSGVSSKLAQYWYLTSCHSAICHFSPVLYESSWIVTSARWRRSPQFCSFLSGKCRVWRAG